MAKKTPDFEQILTEQQKNSKTLEKVVNLLEEGLVKKTGDGLNNNINKFVEEMTVAFKLQNRLLEESNKIQNKVFKKINSESSEAPFKGGQYYGGVRDWAREKNQKTFNMAWWLGITPESKGLTANLVRRRQARQEFVKSAVNIGDLSKKEAKQKFKELNRIRGKRSEVEQQIAKLQKQGLLEEDIQKYKTKEGPSLFELRKQYAEQEKNAVRITKPERVGEEPIPERSRSTEASVSAGTGVPDKRTISEEEGETRIPDVGLGVLSTADTPINLTEDLISPEIPTAISDERVVTEEEKRVFVESEKQTGLLGSIDTELKDIHETLKKCCSQITNIAGGDSGFGIPGFEGGFLGADLPDKNKPRTTSGGAAGGKKGWFQRAKDWTKDLLKSGSKASKGLKIGGGALGVLGGALAISEAISDITDLDEKLEAGLTYIDDQIKNEDISPEEGQKLKDAWYQQIAVEKAGEAGEAGGVIAGGAAGFAAGVALGGLTGPLAPVMSPVLGIGMGLAGAGYGGEYAKDVTKWLTTPETKPTQAETQKNVATPGRSNVSGAPQLPYKSDRDKQLEIIDNQIQQIQTEIQNDPTNQAKIDQLKSLQQARDVTAQQPVNTAADLMAQSIMAAETGSTGALTDESRFIRTQVTPEKNKGRHSSAYGPVQMTATSYLEPFKERNYDKLPKEEQEYLDALIDQGKQMIKNPNDPTLGYGKKGYLGQTERQRDLYAQIAKRSIIDLAHQHKDYKSFIKNFRGEDEQAYFNKIAKEAKTLGKTPEEIFQDLKQMKVEDLPSLPDPNTSPSIAKQDQSSNIQTTQLAQSISTPSADNHSKVVDQKDIKNDARSAGFFGTGETVADRLAAEESWGPDKDWATEAKPVDYKPAGVVPQAALNLEQKMLLAADKPKTAADILEDEFDEAVYQERKNVAEYDIRKNQEAKQKAEAIKQKDLQGLPQADVVGWRSFEGSATPLAPQPMSSADNVYQSSSNVSDTERELKTATPASNVVNAPVVNNVNNQSNVSGPSSPRNTDSAWQKYSSFTYGWGMT